MLLNLVFILWNYALFKESNSPNKLVQESGSPSTLSPLSALQKPPLLAILENPILQKKKKGKERKKKILYRYFLICSVLGLSLGLQFPTVVSENWDLPHTYTAYVYTPHVYLYSLTHIAHIHAHDLPSFFAY